jgi:hypothetical protein
MGILLGRIAAPATIQRPEYAPTLEGQYVVKDIVFLTVGLATATTVRRTTTEQNIGPLMTRSIKIDTPTSKLTHHSFGEKDEELPVRSD